MFASKDIFLKSSGGGYQISRSVRLRSNGSTYFNRTPASAGNRQIWTWSGWIKRGDTSNFSGSGAASELTIFGSGTSAVSGNGVCTLGFTGYDYLHVWQYISGTQWNLVTTQVFRDYSAWYHIVFAVDTTQATASNRIKLYVNGVQVTAFGTASYPSQNYNTGINSTDAHNIGRRPDGQNYWGGYLTENNFIDGQQLTASSFGETNAITGVWQPKAYSGTYGTNGFYLNFSDNSTAAALGTDFSGNSNTWTVNNISVTAGTTYDSMIDVPTPYADGGNGRGNYCTLNPLTSTNSITVNNGNLDAGASSASGNVIRSTLMNNTGKWYFEATVTFSSVGFAAIGVVLDSQSIVSPTSLASVPAGMWLWRNDAQKVNNGTGTAYGTSASSGDIIMVAYDADAGKIWFGRQGTWFASGDPSAGTNEAFSGLTKSIGPCVNFQGTVGSSTFVCNFGQRPFSYTPPTGFVALNTQNLPTPTISNGASYFNTVLYTGNAVQDRAITGFGFDLDLAWIKSRNNAGSHVLVNSVVGGDKQLFSNLTNAEQTNSDMTNGFTTGGILVGDNVTGTGSTNQNTYTYALWGWNAGGSTVTNTSGSISAQVRANPTAGFSIVTYTGTGANATVGHGLGVAPAMFIIKRRSAADSWTTYHKNLTSAAFILELQTTGAQSSVPSCFNSTAPTSSVFSVGTNTGTNGSASTYVAYCFSAVAGYSAFGSYTGNGSADGPFVYLGFRPRFVMIKRTDTSGTNWYTLDTARGTYNANNALLRPNLSDAEISAVPIDFLSNGFKPRDTDSGSNASGGTFIYAAFAENPFKLSLAR